MSDQTGPTEGFLDPLTRLLDALARYKIHYKKLEDVRGERAAITGPLYAKAKKTEKEFKPRVDAATSGERLSYAELTNAALNASKLGVFGEDDKGNPKARYSFLDGSWVQVEKDKVELYVEDWWAVLQNEFIRENLVESVTINFNSAAIALAENGKEIDGVQVHRHRPVKVSIAKEE